MNLQMYPISTQMLRGVYDLLAAQSNGLADRYVSRFKTRLLKNVEQVGQKTHMIN
jgi:hypothetical protein